MVGSELTRLGKTLLDPIQQLAEWAGENRVAIQSSRDMFDSRAKQRT